MLVVVDEVEVVNELLVFVVVVEPLEPAVITKVTTERAGREPPTVPPFNVAEKVDGEETALSM